MPQVHDLLAELDEFRSFHDLREYICAHFAGRDKYAFDFVLQAEVSRELEPALVMSRPLCRAGIRCRIKCPFVICQTDVGSHNDDSHVLANVATEFSFFGDDIHRSKLCLGGVLWHTFVPSREPRNWPFV